MIKVPSGKYIIGTNQDVGFYEDNEKPIVEVELDEFYVDESPVTVQEFAQFVEETGYITEAEIFGYSFVFHLLIPEEKRNQYQRVNVTPWWLFVEGASWKTPEGETSSVLNRMNHPVTHVSRNDAVAYCEWAGKRLPTEAEWEVFAKGGTNNTLYPWGDVFLLNQTHQCNTFQGEFPNNNNMEDGYLGTSPVGSYPANNYEIYDIIGNVWEWCANPKAIDLNEFRNNSSENFWGK